MKELYCMRCILLAHDNGKIQFGGALSDHQNIDCCCAKSAEGSSSNAWNAFYPIADQRNDCNVRDHRNAIDSSSLDLSFELTAQRFHGLFSVVASNDQRDVLFG